MDSDGLNRDELLYKNWDMLVEKIRPKLLEASRQEKWLKENTELSTLGKK